MISHLTYQAGQAHLEDIRRYRTEHPSAPRERTLTIRARFTALVPRRRRQVLPGAVLRHRLVG